MGRRDRRAMESHLIILMQHIIKWKTQTNSRTKSWKLSIDNARREIIKIQKNMPSISNAFIESVWQESFHDALEIAETEMKRKSDITSLSWYEVFEEEYTL
jgi:hypothetical protein